MSQARDELWIHPNCRRLETDRVGQFVPLDEGALLTVADDAALVSDDDGRTWTELAKVSDQPAYGAPRAGGGGSGTILKTRSGTIVLVYMDLHKYKLNWDPATDTVDADLDVWAVRSLDNGRTWVDRQKVLDGYCGSLQNMIQTSGGHIVVPVQDVLTGPLRNAQYAFVSDDDGATWKRSNLIDVGGCGDHDGGFEGTIEELRGGKLWMLIRTNLDVFWSAYSDDNGCRWRVLEPSRIDASSSPGFLLRLASGRLMLAWNRLYPDGLDDAAKAAYPRHGRNRQAETNASWQRDELAIAFSDDDGRTWTKPEVIMRKKDANLAYPYIFERHPGELWVIATQAALRAGVRLLESDFVDEH